MKKEIMLMVLGLIDVVMIANLLIMVIIKMLNNMVAETINVISLPLIVEKFIHFLFY